VDGLEEGHRARAGGVEREGRVVGVGERAVEQGRRVGEQHHPPLALAGGDGDRPRLGREQRLGLPELRPDAAAAERDRADALRLGRRPRDPCHTGRAAPLRGRLGDDVAQPSRRAAAGDEPHPAAHARADRGGLLRVDVLGLEHDERLDLPRLVERTADALDLAAVAPQQLGIGRGAGRRGRVRRARRAAGRGREPLQREHDRDERDGEHGREPQRVARHRSASSHAARAASTSSAAAGRRP
jgi:hypothetical protein